MVYFFYRQPIQRKHLKYILLLWACLCYIGSNAQKLSAVDAITIADGLGFRDVSAICQDQQGLMWFGTLQGLNRYDGYNFTYYNKGPVGEYQLPAEDFAERGLVIKDSVLWFIANKQLFTLHLKDNSTEHIPLYADDQSKTPLSILQIHKGKKGRLWVVGETETQQYLQVLQEEDIFVPFQKVDRLEREFTEITTDTAGNIWWTTIIEGIQQFSPTGDLLHEIKADSFNWYGTEMYFTPLFINSKNDIFLFPKSKDEIWQYRPENKNITVLQTQLTSPIYTALEDHQGHCWFATKTGLLKMDKQQQWVDYSSTVQGALKFSEINCLFEDQTHLLWLGTNNGLLKIPVKERLFQNHLYIEGAEWGNTTRGFFEDEQGQVFVMCENGERGIHQLIPSKGQTQARITADSFPDGTFPLELAKSFVFDKKRKRTWTATDRLLFFKTANPDNRVQSLEKEGEIASRFSPNPLIQLSNGDLLLGHTLQQLAIYSPTTQTYRFVLTGADSFPQAVQTKCFLEMEESLWVGTKDSGLLKLSKSGEILQRYTTQSTPALSNNNILCLEQDEAGILWIGTFGGGLNRLDPVTDEVKVYTQRDNLADNNVVGVLPYKDDYLWISTYNGLSCFHIPTATFQNFYEEDGLTHNEFNYTSYFKDSEGRYYFGGMNGVNSFFPGDIIQQAPNPPLQLLEWTKFSPKGEQLKKQDLRYFDGQALTVFPVESYFQVNWTLPNYFKPDKNQYYTLLEGLEEDWTYIGHQPSVRYNKLPAGEYTLHIKGADSRGNWSNSQLSIPIKVKPFFVNTWWFIVLSMLALTYIIYLFFQYRWLQLLKVERMRLKISSNLHDEVGSMLSGLAMQAEIMEIKAAPQDKPGLKTLSDISRQAVSKMRDLVWSIDTRRDKVRHLLERIQEHAEEMLIPQEISFEFKTGPLPLDKKLPIEIRQHLQLIIREALTNITKHATDVNQVVITLKNEGKYFYLTIQDNGKSPKNDIAQTTGLGIENMKMRAHKLKGELHILAAQEGFLVQLRMQAL